MFFSMIYLYIEKLGVAVVHVARRKWRRLVMNVLASPTVSVARILEPKLFRYTCNFLLRMVINNKSDNTPER